MKKIYTFLFLLFFGTPICFAQQNPKNTVYLLFNTSSSETCKVDVEGEGYQQLNKFRKENIENYIIFNICEEEFVFVKQRATKDTLSSKQAGKIEYSDLKYLNNRYEDSKPRKFKHNVFETIYIIEKVSKNHFVKYTVGWTDEQLGWIE